MTTLKGTLSPRTLTRTLKSTLKLKTLKRILLSSKISSFLEMVYDRVDDGHKFSHKNYGLARPRFHAAVNWKLELNNFSRKR